MYRHTYSLDASHSCVSADYASCPGWHPSALPVIEISFFCSHHMALPPPTLSLIDFKSSHVFKKRWAVRTGRHWERLAGVLCSCRKVSVGDKRLGTPSFFSPMVNPLLFFMSPVERNYWRNYLISTESANLRCVLIPFHFILECTLYASSVSFPLCTALWDRKNQVLLARILTVFIFSSLVPFTVWPHIYTNLTRITLQGQKYIDTQTLHSYVIKDLIPKPWTLICCCNSLLSSGFRFLIRFGNLDAGICSQ